ncbi:MAG: glycosyltransferase family 9 protein [Erysipelotrichaceae bacterium]|jgi:ADP-heptose:LPS heptosyltransferase|nr:glycosyltransferase family 9 protein [Erysipelotrichaceae bacterium]MCH4044077.1 glycosyltransferase family 9 protein [Erysipelotrichaceae bacterium]MCH4121292.1 glycosyltransferase family 9 protein [Erysipelotrichaceae bacterium]
MTDKKEYSISKNFLSFNQLLWKNPLLKDIRLLFFAIDDFLLIGSKTPSKEISPRKKVLVVYNMALGDGIMFYGVSHGLREVWPADKFELTIVCQKAFKQLYEVSGILDKVIPLDFSGAAVNLKKRKALFEKLRSVHYDVLFDPVGAEEPTTNVFVSRAAVADTKIGVINDALPTKLSKKKLAKIYNRILHTSKENIHLIRNYAEAIQKLGAANCIAKPADLPHVKLDFDLPERFFIMFPVASMDVKKWNVQHYAEIALKIQRKTGLPMVLCGTEHDRPSLEEMMKYAGDIKYIDVVGKTDIMEFTEVIGRASLVVTNDTSAYHIAVARNVTTFMICGGYTFDRYAHYQYADQGRKDPYLITHKMPCYNCNNNCIYKNFTVFPCIDLITVDDAWNVISDVLDKEMQNG